MEPARYFVQVIKREKRACRGCEQSTVTMAPLPPRIVEKGLASDNVVIDAVVSKYCDHLPLYRQAVILEREAGLEIGRATLDGWVMRVGEMLIPVMEAMRKDLLSAAYLQADETTVPVQMHDRRGSNHEAYLWQYGKPGGETVFDFCLHRGREGPKRFLGNWEGILQTDGYQAYEGVGGPKIVHVGCWAHARRKFVDAVKVNPQDAEAVKMVMRMDALFLVDRDARQKAMSGAERLAQRRELGAAVGGGDSGSVPDAVERDAAQECIGQGGGVHAQPMAEAGALSGARGSRAVQQPGGELDAAGGVRAQELAARGQREGGTESGGDSLRGGIVPPDRRAGEGVSRRRTAGVGTPHAE